MAKQDLLSAGGSLRGEGQDESNPIMNSGAFFKTNGIRGSDEGHTERIEGKLLHSSWEEPITAIHSIQSATPKFWIQTPTTLYMVDALTDIP